MSDTQAEAQIVIYGGGIAGALLAKSLSAQFQVVLVDPNDYFEVPMSVPRSLVKPDFANEAIIPFSAALGGVQHVRGALIELRPEAGVVQLADGPKETIKGRITVLATGSAFSNSLMRAISGASAHERKAFYRDYHQRIAQAQRILIVGGGPIGVEVAGEIIEQHPGKVITVLEAGPRLLAGTSQAAASYATQFLKDRGVTILTNERLDSTGSSSAEVFTAAGEARTERGRTIAYDLLIWAIGGKPNTGYMTAHFKSSLNAAGRIRVSPELRVLGAKSLFALGDITDLDENKMAWHVTGQVKAAAHNIRTLLAEPASAPKLKAYKPQTGNPNMAVTLGSRNGVVHLSGLGAVHWAPFVRMAKSAHMLVPKTRKALGV